MEFVDIAGLVKGASQGEGLGNQFLANIRETEAIVHVVRAFENEDIVHVAGKVSPIDDIEVINTELVLADLGTVEKLYQKASKSSKSGEKEGLLLKNLLEKILPNLENGENLRSLTFSNEEQKLLRGFQLLMEVQNLALIFGGVLIGVLVGALPGLSSPMAIALLMPFTISLDPVASISMMAALYCAGTFGGSITAILINAPGAPPAVATALDGYMMAKNGEPGRALVAESGSTIVKVCLLYTSPSPRDGLLSRMPSSA